MEVQLQGAPPNAKTHRPLTISTCVSSLGGFLFGYDNIVISGAIGHLARYYRLEPLAIGWAAGCALIGCLLGSACSGAVADRFGLKRALYVCASCFALSAFGVWLASSFALFVWWRIVGGIGIGAASIVAPMYIAEIAPAAVRGRLVVFYQFGIVVGILSAVFVNMLIERISQRDVDNTARLALDVPRGSNTSDCICTRNSLLERESTLADEGRPGTPGRSGADRNQWR
jgi:predicted MFS family arabinose efflux permease